MNSSTSWVRIATTMRKEQTLASSFGGYNRPDTHHLYRKDCSSDLKCIRQFVILLTKKTPSTAPPRTGEILRMTWSIILDFINPRGQGKNHTTSLRTMPPTSGENRPVCMFTVCASTTLADEGKSVQYGSKRQSASITPANRGEIPVITQNSRLCIDNPRIRGKTTFSG